VASVDTPSGHGCQREVNPTYTWDGGYLYGDYAGCGWIRSERDLL
jgi:hypothetical protein